MYPYDLFWGITLYDIFIILGLCAAVGVFLFYADKRKFDSNLQVLVLADAAAAVLLGFGAAMLMQAIYNYIESGVFEWNGMTFYGGFVGGAAVFLAGYFGAGHLLYRKAESKPHLENAFTVFGIVSCCVIVAHAFGRIGCLTAGCCHGAVYEECRPFTVPLLHISTENKLISKEYTVPVQLFEALFLFALFAVLSYRVLKGKQDVLPLYMICYGVWRFAIEFARADERGETIVSFLTPSQLVAVLLVLGGIAFYVFLILRKRKASPPSSPPSSTV